MRNTVENARHTGDTSITGNCTPRISTSPNAKDLPLGSTPWEKVTWWERRPPVPGIEPQQVHWGRDYGPVDFVFALVESLPRSLAAPICKKCPQGLTIGMTPESGELSDEALARLYNLGANTEEVDIATGICGELWRRLRSKTQFNNSRCSMNGGCESLHSLVESVKEYYFPVPDWKFLSANYHVNRVSSRHDTSPYSNVVAAVGHCTSEKFATAVADGIIIPVGCKTWLEGSDSHLTCLGAGWRAISDYHSYEAGDDDFSRTLIEAASVGEAVRMELLLHVSESERTSEGIGSKEGLVGAALRRMVESHALAASFRHQAPKRTWLLSLLWILLHDFADLRADFANKNPDNLCLWWDNPRDAAVSALLAITSILEHHGWSWWHHAAFAVYHVWSGRRYNLAPNAGTTEHAAIPSLKIPRGVAVVSPRHETGNLSDQVAVGFLKDTPVLCETYFAAAIDLWNAQCDVGFGGLDLDPGEGDTTPWGHG